MVKKTEHLHTCSGLMLSPEPSNRTHDSPHLCFRTDISSSSTFMCVTYEKNAGQQYPLLPSSRVPTSVGATAYVSKPWMSAFSHKLAHARGSEETERRSWCVASNDSVFLSDTSGEHPSPWEWTRQTSSSFHQRTKHHGASTRFMPKQATQ